MKKSKLNKKSKKKNAYIPIYANGGFPIAEGYGNTINAENSGMSPLNGNKGGGFNNWYQNNYKSVGSASAGVHASGVNNMNGTGIDTYGDQGYNAGMAAVSKAGPIGGIIGGLSAVGDAIGKPIRAKTEAVDQSSGKYKDIGKAERWRTLGNYANPFKAGMDAAGDPNASFGEIAGSFLSIPGVQRSITRRREGERIAEVKEQQHQEAIVRRLGEEPQSTMQFPNGGTLATGSNFSENYGYTPEQIRMAQQGTPVSQQALKDPQTGKVIGYEQYQKGVKGPQYIPIETSVAPMINRNISTIKKANGGKLEGTEFNKDLTYFSEGGSHNENPNGGIPLGNKGLVEEGEFKYKDYIFSNRF